MGVGKGHRFGLAQPEGIKDYLRKGGGEKRKKGEFLWTRGRVEWDMLSVFSEREKYQEVEKIKRGKGAVRKGEKVTGGKGTNTSRYVGKIEELRF